MSCIMLLLKSIFYIQTKTMLLKFRI